VTPAASPVPGRLSYGEGTLKKKPERPDRNYRERVYKIVRRIPKGQVMTYGQIAYMLGEGYTPRTVGLSCGPLTPGIAINSRVVAQRVASFCRQISRSECWSMRRWLG
jgi:alkylated DNA nucleotide flippase Atl1